MEYKGNVSGGFTLVELLLALALVGVFASAVFGLLHTTTQTAVRSEEKIEIQQNLRIAMDQVSREVRLAGLMTSRDQPAVLVAEPDRLRLLMATTTERVARIVEEHEVTGLNSTEPFRVASSRMAELFSNTEKVRILRPPAFTQPFDDLLEVSSTNPGTRTIRLRDFPSLGEPVLILPGDLIVQTTQSGPFPNSVQFCLGPAPGCGPFSAACPSGQTCLMRVIGQAEENSGIASVVAGRLSPQGLQLNYLLDDDRELPSVTGEELRQIRAVRISLTGLGTPILADSRRSLSSLSRLRNR